MNPFSISMLSAHDRESALQLMEEVFAVEQGIPKHLLPVTAANQMGFGLWSNGLLVGIAIAWEESDGWHWGRFALRTEFRGMGWGSKLAVYSFREIFKEGIPQLHITARDQAVPLLKKLGANTVAPAFDFYGAPVTPMVLRADGLVLSSGY